MRSNAFFRSKLANQTGKFHSKDLLQTLSNTTKASSTLVHGRNPTWSFGLMPLQCWPQSLVNQFCKNFVCNFEYSNWTPIARRKQIATLWQHCKDSVTPTRVKATNCKHMIEHIQETFVQVQVAMNKTFSHQTTGISAFVPSHFLQNYLQLQNRERFYIWQAVSWCFFQ